jgi:hypothetical protein
MSFVNHILLGVFLIGSNAFGGTAVLSSISHLPERKIANYFSEIVETAFLKPETARNLMSSHYEYLKLRSADGVWVSPALQRMCDTLLPVTVTQSDFQILLDNMADAAGQNPYLNNVFEVLTDEKKFGIQDSFKMKIETAAPDLLTYAMVLNNMTKAMVANPDILASVNAEFDKHVIEQAAMGWAHKVKYYSVRAAIQNSLAVHKSRDVPGDFSSFLLPLNIAEASVLDLFYGKSGNSKAGLSLIKHGPSNCVDPVSGARPACFNKDQTAIALNMPFSEDWANLYAAWNLGFVASLSSFPYHAIKLLIPAVNAFHEEPGLYMYNRVCALYVHAHYLAMRQFKDPKFSEVDYSDTTIAKIFSAVNYTNATLYEANFDI